MKTFAYLRISTDETNQSNSFKTQENLIREKYPIIDGVYADACSGSTSFSKRTEWVKLVQQLSSDDTVVVLRMDRLSRDVLEWLVVEKMLEKMNVSIKFIDGVSGSSPMDKMVRTILSAVAEMEKALIGQRIREAKAKLKSENKHLGGSVPFGYDKDSDGYLIPNSKEQSVIEVMKDGRNNMNLSYSKLSGYLDDLGHKTRKGTSFTSMTVSRILKYNE